MQREDKTKFVTLMQALAAAFKAEPTPALLEGYWLGLRDLDIDAIENAVAGSLRASKFMPTPAELRALTGGPTVELAALHAWQAVRRSIGSVGSYRSVDFGPLVNAVVRNLGGWQRLCREDAGELDKWIRKDFERVYGVLAASGVGADAGLHLAGIHERENGAGTYQIAPVRVAIESQLPAKQLNGVAATAVKQLSEKNPTERRP